MKVLWTGEVYENARAALDRYGLILEQFGPRDLVDEDRFIDALAGCQVYVNGGFEVASERVIRSAADLRLIVYLGANAGTYVDLDAAKQRGITVCNTPGANAKSVAEIAIALAISATRRIPAGIASVAAGEWHSPVVSALHGLRIGLLGMGHIAQAFARFLRLGLDADVLYWSPTRKPAVEADLAVRYADRLDLLSQVNMVSLHLPEQAGVVLGAAEFEAMKPGAILINTARPQLVDAEALDAALSSGRLAFAAFDGFYGEGTRDLTAAEERILRLGPDKFIATPHIGWRTKEADVQAQAIGIRSLVEFLKDEPVSNRVA
jgi:phosphoglycerate dehydrogenase-like enzyme